MTNDGHDLVLGVFDWVSSLLAVSTVASVLSAEPGGVETDDGNAGPSEAVSTEPPQSLGHAVTSALRAGNPGYGALLGYRLRVRRGIAVGVELEANYAPEAFIGGYAVRRNTVVAARLPVFFPVLRTPALTMALTLTPGLRITRSARPGPTRSGGLSVSIHPGVFAYLHVSPPLTWMLGVDLPTSIQVDPITDVDQVGALLVNGPLVPLSDRLSWFAVVEAGGLFGSGGDAGKFLVRGTTGLRWVMGASARRWRAF